MSIEIQGCVIASYICGVIAGVLISIFCIEPSKAYKQGYKDGKAGREPTIKVGK